MNLWTLRLGLLPLLALSTLHCGVDPNARWDDEAASQTAALRTAEAATPNAHVLLECGAWHVEITKATGSDRSRSRSEAECEDNLTAARPRVRCESCDIRGACQPLTRRSDIITRCEQQDGTWRCNCAQRSVLGCSPCWDIDRTGSLSSPIGCGAQQAICQG